MLLFPQRYFSLQQQCWLRPCWQSWPKPRAKYLPLALSAPTVSPVVFPFVICCLLSVQNQKHFRSLELFSSPPFITFY